MKTFRHGIILIVIFAVSLVTCNNFFHDLIPPDGDRITSFEVDGQTSSAVIEDNSVRVTVAKGTEIHSIIPQIGISRMASIIPVTLDYVQAAFPDADLVKETLGLYQTQDLTGYVEDMIKRNPGFNIPGIDIPIDFSSPVKFFVISAQGTMREYTVYLEEDSGEPVLLSMRFTKYDNAELVNDAVCSVNETSRSIYAQATYPMEMTTLSYSLIPSFEILGDSIVVDGAEIESGIDAIQFSPVLGTQTKTITVTREEQSTDYVLTILFSEDPDTIRSITDFRFNKTSNSSITTTAVASIINNENTGTITIQVFYSGAQPSYLTPSFVTPGTASVNGIQQYSSLNSHDFSLPLEYYVVSRNGQYSRTYTVRTEFILITYETPRILDFRFSRSLNHELVQDTSGVIGDEIIMIDVYYSGASAPEALMPEFSAGGPVTVSGSVQVSGASSQNFTRQIKYTVTNPEMTSLKRDYWVQTRMIRDTSSDASITTFGFYPEDNTGLADEITGRIDQNTGNISVYAPVGSGVTTRVMIPRFTAAGQVSVGETAQSSGISALMFDAPVTYTVTSANGSNSRSYTVTVRELQSTIYVNPNAVLGYNDGTSWQNAFTSLKDAIEAAALFQENIPKEIWITAGTYKPTDTGNKEEYFRLVPNTSYIGGFAGNETAKSQRNTAANKVTISGNLGGGVYSNNLFGAFNGASAITLNGDLGFEDIDFIDARAQLSGDRGNGAAINAVLFGSAELDIDRCTFTGFQANGNGGSIYNSGGNLTITDAVIINSKAGNGGAVYASGSSIVFSNIKTTGTEADSNGGSFYFTGTERKSLSDITIENSTSSGDDRDNSGGGGIFIYGGYLTITDFVIRNTNASADGGALFISNCNVVFYDSSFSNTIAHRGGAMLIKEYSDIALYNVNIDTATAKGVRQGLLANGGAMHITNSKAAFYNVTINNSDSDSYGGGIFHTTTLDNNGNLPSRTGSLTMTNSVITNTTAFSGGGIWVYSAESITITNSVFRNITAGYSGGAINAVLFSSDSNVFSNLTIENVTVSSRDYYLHLYGDSYYDLFNDDGSGYSGGSGGGIYCSYGNVIITDSVFRNTKGGNGGAVYYLSSSGSIILSNVTTSNTQGTNGGSFYLTGPGNKTLSNVTIDTATTHYNYFEEDGYISTAGDGGGIYSAGGILTITDSVIKNTNGGYNGGAVYSSDGTVNFSNVSINNTEATNGAGGSIYFSGTGSKTLSDVAIDGAIAREHGGGIYSTSGTLTITDSVIRNIKSVLLGGAVYSDGNVNFSNLTTSNTQAFLGGSLYLSGGTLSNVTIDNATANYEGGGIYNYGGNITITDSVIRNTKGSSGGAVYSSNSSVNFSNLTTNNTQATNGSGGSLYLSGGTLSNITIDNATANNYGGGIYNYLGNFTITDSVITNAKGHVGGAMFIHGGLISNSKFEKCTADNAGALYIESNVEIENTTFLNCTAKEYYNIMQQQQNTIVRNCTFIHDDDLPDLGSQSNLNRTGLFSHYGTFENCTFTNLRFTNRSGENYIFSRWSIYSGVDTTTGAVYSGVSSLTLKNCIFNLKNGSAGILALYNNATSYYDQLLVDGAVINDNGCQQPLIWLYGNATANAFQFRNITYNEIPLTSAYLPLMSLTGAIKLENNATVVFLD